jgi:hypothetical protein
LALIALAGVQLLVDCAPEVSRHGRACPGHPRRAATKRESAIRALCKAHQVKALGSALTRRRDAPARVNGRDKPGRDALGPAREAIPLYRFSGASTVNDIRAKNLLAKNRNPCYGLISSPEASAKDRSEGASGGKGKFFSLDSP